MKFEALQARYGDCLLLSFQRPNERPLRLLVDGGPSRVYDTFLRPRLEEEREEWGEDELLLDAVMISHIDADHITGVIDMFQELQDAEQSSAPWPFKPRWLLHNSFDSIVGEGEGGTARVVGGATILANFGAELLAGLGDGDVEARDTIKILQSYPQGSTLSRLAAALKITRNPPDQKPIMCDPAAPRVLKIGDAKLTIFGPLEDELETLQKKWKEAKKKQKEDKKKKALQALAAYLDKSAPNLSSIVALVESDKKKVLITGDARGDKVLEALRAAKKIKGTTPLKVDVLKLPHHGSVRNVDTDFFELIHARHYIASGDGTHGNPDRATLELLEKHGPASFTIHLTYAAKACDEMHKKDLESKGKSFKPATDAIADIIARWKKKGSKRKVKEGPVKIDL